MLQTTPPMQEKSFRTHNGLELLISGDDRVVHHRPQHRFFEGLATTVKENQVLPGFHHDALGEKNCASFALLDAQAAAARRIRARDDASVTLPSLQLRSANRVICDCSSLRVLESALRLAGKIHSMEMRAWK